MHKFEMMITIFGMEIKYVCVFCVDDESKSKFSFFFSESDFK